MGDAAPADGRVELALYPEVVRAGGLAEALTEVAERHGIDIGPVESHDPTPMYVGVHLTSERGPVEVSLRMGPRGFTTTVNGPTNGYWASGVTEDLLQAARAVEAWRAGAVLRDLAARFPFMSYDGLAQACEDGTQVEYQWHRLLSDADLAPYRPLLSAVYEHPVLGRLSPSVSHRNLLRLALPSWTKAYAEIHVIALRDKIQVEASWDMHPRYVRRAEEAVELAAALLAAHPDAPT